MLDPTTQADILSDNRPSLLCQNASPIPLTQVMIHPLVSLSRPIFATLPVTTSQFGPFRSQYIKEKRMELVVLGKKSGMIQVETMRV